MKAIAPQGPFEDEEGRRWHNIKSAAEILGICRVTLFRWASAGRAPPPLDFNMATKYVPVPGSTSGGKAAPRTHLQQRMVLEEGLLYTLKEKLTKHPVRRGYIPNLKRGKSPSPGTS